MYSLYIVQAVCDVSFIGDSILVVHPGSFMDYSADKKNQIADGTFPDSVDIRPDQRLLISQQETAEALNSKGYYVQIENNAKEFVSN